MSKVKQVTFAELVEDPIYRQWFDRPPTDHEHTRWRVYVKVTKKSPWAKRDFLTWKKARKFVRKHADKWYDCVLVCRNDAHRPPVIRVGRKRQYYAPMVNMVGHTWCPYCRRPTIFGWFTEHHAFTNGLKPLAYKKRCSICGIAQSAIKEYSAKETTYGA